MSELPAERLERLLAGELSPEEQRRLAQAALDDPDLFDQLTAVAAVASTSDRDRTREAPIPFRRPAPVRGFRRAAMTAAAVAAMIALAIGYRWRSAGPEPSAPESASVQPSEPNPATTSRPAPVAVAPILLTVYAGGSERAPAAFRADDTARRVPKAEGLVISENAGIIEIDLGSLDGLTQGLELGVTRAEKSDAEIGRVTIATVFREQSRGRTPEPAAVHQGDRIHMAPDVHVTALLNQITARRSAGDTSDVRTLAETAATAAQNPGVSADLRAQALNELGALQIDQREYDAAERTLQTALTQAGTVAKLRVTNNLGALAALRGDRATAEALYRQARSLADAAALDAERAAIDKNLDALAQAR